MNRMDAPATMNSSASRCSPRKAKTIAAGAHIESRIRNEQSITVEGPIKKPDCSSTFESGRWNSTIFPKHHPNQRDDVMLLDDWITERLVEVAKQRSDALSWSESSAKFSQDQLKILDLGFSEICRQVAIQCSQRAELMNRLWQGSHEIYEKLLTEMTATIESLRMVGGEWQKKCEKMQAQLDAQEWRHSQELKRVELAAKTSKSEDSVIYREMQEEIFNREKDMGLMENILADLSIWFPNFNSYSTSVLRKHLPPIEDCAGLLLRYGQALGQNSEQTVLPQDLLYQDLKRLEKLDIGFFIQGQESQSPSRVPSRGSNNREMEMKTTAERAVEPNAVRSLLFENQLQSVVVEELQMKYSTLSKQHESDVSSLKQRIDNLLIENYTLREHSGDSGGGGGVGGGDAIILHKLPPILQLRGGESLSAEIQEMWNSKKSTSATPPSTLISPADLQKFLIQFTNSYLCSLSPSCWTLHTAPKMILGREIPSEGMRSTLSSLYGGVKATELKFMNCETLMSHYLIIQKGATRLARDALRRVLWAVMIWAQQTNSGSSFSRYQHLVEGLPRQLLEHEKALILTFTQAFSFDSLHSESRSSPSSSTTSNETNEPIKKVPGLDEIFFNLYLRSMSAMKGYLTWNPKAMGINSPTSTNLFLTASPSLVPTQEIDKILTRIFSVSEPEALYKRPSSLAISAPGSDATPPSDESNLPFEKSNQNKCWWNFLPSRIALLIRDDLILLTNKNAGISIDAFEIILTIWTHLKKYRESLFFVLEELFKYLTGCVGSPTDISFQTLLVAILEKNINMTSPLHQALSYELVTMSTSETLNCFTFAEMILSKNFPLSGLHILFDAGPRTKRELRKDGETLFSQLTSNFANHDENEGVSISDDAVMRHAQLYFDTYSPHLEQPPPELAMRSLAIYPEVYFSVTCLKFLNNFIDATGELSNFTSFHLEAKASRFRFISSLRKYFRGWIRHLHFKKGTSDSEGEEDEDEEEAEDFFEKPTRRPFS